MSRQRVSASVGIGGMVVQLAGGVLGMGMTAGIAVANGAPDGHRRSLSPWHQAQDGNGRTIPCVCVVKGQLVPLGSSVCLLTPTGWQIARCDLIQNVTSWVPTGVPCTTSSIEKIPLSRSQNEAPT